MTFIFTKKMRLLTFYCFNSVFNKSYINKVSCIIILNRINLFNYCRIGLVISKKNIKKSYNRNRIKRLIRESFRIHQNMFYPMDFIVIIKQRGSNLKNYVLLNFLNKLWYYYYR